MADELSVRSEQLASASAADEESLLGLNADTDHAQQRALARDILRASQAQQSRKSLLVRSLRRRSIQPPSLGALIRRDSRPSARVHRYFTTEDISNELCNGLGSLDGPDLLFVSGQWLIVVLVCLSSVRSISRARI